MRRALAANTPLAERRVSAASLSLELSMRLSAIILMSVLNVAAVQLSSYTREERGLVTLPSYGEVRLKTRSSLYRGASAYLCASAYRDGRRALLYEVTRRAAYLFGRELPYGIRICVLIRAPYPKRM